MPTISGALRVACTRLRGPCDGACDRVAGHGPWEEEADRERHPGRQEVDAQPAKERLHRYGPPVSPGMVFWAGSGW